MSSESGPQGGRRAPQIDVRFDLEELDATARERIERLIESTVSRELARESEESLPRCPIASS